MPTKTAPAGGDTALIDRPRTAPDVAVHEPVEDGAPWVVQRGHHQHFRVAPDLARLIRTLDGTRDHAELAQVLGPPWTSGHVDTAVRKLAGSKLLDDGRPRRRRASWVRFVPPLTVQFTVVRPERVLARLVPVISALANRAMAVLAAAVAVGGILALALLAPALTDALGRPLPLAAYLGVVAGVLATTVVHEIGHGAVLTYYGGRPSRMGVMLFYLSPAFFCDVSDGWRLPHPQQRVKVALAGITTQTVIAGSAALTALFLGPTTLRDALLVLALTTYVSGLVNLLPLVKLDGYIALMSHLDIPHLRDRAMTDGRRYLTRVLFGGRYERELPGRSWVVPYGLACAAFPLYIVAGALALWSDVLQRMGPVGAWMLFLGLGYLVYRLGAGYVRACREARAAGGRAWRMAAVTAVVAGAVTAAALLVHLPLTVSGGYVTRADGRVELVLPTSADRTLIREGATVELLRSGLMTKKQTGSATVATAAPAESTASISAFLPVRTDALPSPVLAYRLHVGHAPEDRTGAARIDAGSRPLWDWALTKYIAPVWR
ncbi:daptide biosynthesis intramembrane metalloprotease [Streptomyces flavidovirens]|uniref:daptide biosynthesis intramembrane metalloprotease n=1 Tax=Streptomyces flavidovirens TaxID=67298 RepID=UPI0033BB481C